MPEPPAGWLAPHVEQTYTELETFNGWHVTVVCYYAVPQRTLVLHLSEGEVERMLILYNCRTIRVADCWTIGTFDFQYDPYGQKLLDALNGIEVEFDGGQVVTRKEGLRHVAKVNSTA